MTCIIVDDDERSRVFLQTLCEGLENLEIIELFDSGLKAINWLKSNEVDVIFLDIEMPEISGIDLVKSVENLPQIIFTTSHAKYAVEAFEYQVTDFLPKPVALPRLLKAIDRAQQLLDNVKPQEDDELFVRVDGRYVRIDLNKILFIESLGDYITFNSEDGKKYIVHSTVKNIAQKITHKDFIKVHRSFVINLAKVVDIEDTNLVIGEKVIPISRAHRLILMNRIKKL